MGTVDIPYQESTTSTTGQQTNNYRKRLKTKNLFRHIFVYPSDNLFISK